MRDAATRNRLLAAGVASLVVAVLAFALFGSDTSESRDTGREARLRDAAASASEGLEASRESSPWSLTPSDVELEEFIVHLRERYGATIDHPSTRIALIEKAMAYLQRAHPADWAERMHELLARAFPNRAEELASMLDKRLRYAELLEARRADYEGLDPKDRRESVWADRYRVFGDEADMIWAAARRGEQVQIALEEIDEGVTDAGLDAQLDRYVSAIEEAYGERAIELTSRRQTELVNHFLEVDAVQEELRALEPDARGSSLRMIRGALGMDAPALDRWDALDSRRDQTWDQGVEYEKRRRRLEATPDEAGAVSSIRELQDQTFGEAADMIRAEESAGFYRFAGPRRIGRE